jgi:hypothetical protein
MRGHFYGELVGLCCHPRMHYFYTVGQDSWLMHWSAVDKRLSASLKLDYQSNSIDISSDGRFLSVGCHNGNVLIVDPTTLVV